jgi:hypothetical protein
MKRHHAHIPLLILAVSVAAFVAASYIYMFYRTRASIIEASLSRGAIKAEQAGQSQARSLISIASTTASDRARLESFFIPASGVVSFITALESIGPRSGSEVSLSSIDADTLAGAAHGTVGYVRARVQASGSWSSVMRTLALAENLSYASSVSGIRLDSSARGASRVWQLSFDIRAAMIADAPSESGLDQSLL